MTWNLDSNDDNNDCGDDSNSSNEGDGYQGGHQQDGNIDMEGHDANQDDHFGIQQGDKEKTRGRR